MIDTGELLAGILQETESEAERERRQREQELAQRADEELQRQREISEKRRRIAEETIAQERERQRVAQQRRDLVMRTLAEPELTPEELAAREAEKLAQQQAAMLHVAQAYQAGQVAALSGAFPVRRRLSPYIAIAATTIALATAAVLFVVLTREPALDPTNYPKTALVFQMNPISRPTTVNLHLIPVPEPEIAPSDQIVAEPTSDQNRRNADRNRRNRDRDRQAATNSDSSSSTTDSTLNIDLDGANIFNRGSEQ